MNRKQRRIQKRRVRRVGIVVASVAMLGATAGLGGAAFGAGYGGGGPGGGSGAGYGTGGGASGGIILPGLGIEPGAGGSNFHGDTCQVTGPVVFGLKGGGPAIVYGVLIEDLYGKKICVVTI